MAWQLTDVTTGVDLSAAVDATSLVVTQRAYAEASRLSALIHDEAAALTIAVEHEVLLVDGAQKVFAGLVRQLVKTDTGASGQRIYKLECQDYSTLLADDYIPAGGGARTVAESDKTRITAIFAAYGTRGIAIGASVVQLVAQMPAVDYSGQSLHQFLTEVAKVSGGSFYVDYDKVLHYFSTEVNAAPFGLSDNPNGSTTFGYEQFSEATDSVDFVNEVHVIGAPGISATRYLGGSPPAAGTRRATVVQDPEIADVAAAQARGDAVIAVYGQLKKPSTLVTYKAGLRAGQYVQVTHAGWGISALSYRIAGLSARPGTKDRISYQVDFGTGSVDLASLIGGTVGAVGDAAAAAAAAANAVAQVDLSVGGANLIPNSSFETGASWIVGASWAIGVESGAPAPAPGRPFAAPVAPGTVTISGLDATGATDVQAGLNAQIAAAPNGSTIQFPTNAIYRLSKGILMAGKTNLILKGNGTTLNMYISGSDEAASAFLLRGSSHIAIENFDVWANESTWPVINGENAHCLGLSGWYGGAPSTYVEIFNVHASHMYGDFAYLEGKNVAPNTPSSFVWIHGCSLDYSNRMGVAMVNVTDVWIEDNDFDHMSYHAIDFEPNFAADQVRRVIVRNNTFGSYGHTALTMGCFVSDTSFGGVASDLSDVTIEDNTVVGIAANGMDGTPRALQTRWTSTGNRHSGIAFARNFTTRAVSASFGSGGVFYADQVDGITIEDNTQPLTSGVLARFDSCTAVVSDW